MARRIAAALRDRLVRLLISVTDRAAARSRVPNPMAGMRVVLTQLADQDLLLTRITCLTAPSTVNLYA